VRWLQPKVDIGSGIPRLEARRVVKDNVNASVVDFIDVLVRRRSAGSIYLLMFLSAAAAGVAVD